MAETKDYMTQELENGSLSINEEVITTVTLAALRDVEGVANQKNDRKSIRVTLCSEFVEVECSLVVIYGHSVMEIAKNVQNAVTNAVESMTGLKVSRVDVNVTGISMGKQA